MPSTVTTARCAVCHRPDFEWLSCTSPACDPAEAAFAFPALAALLRPLPNVGVRCMTRLGRGHIEGTIVARLTLDDGEAAFVELHDLGDVVVVPLADVQVMP